MTKYDSIEYFYPFSSVHSKLKTSGFENKSMNGVLFFEDYGIYTNNQILGVVELDDGMKLQNTLFFAFAESEENQISYSNTDVSPVSQDFLFESDIKTEMPKILFKTFENFFILDKIRLLENLNIIGDKSKHRFSVEISSGYADTLVIFKIVDDKSPDAVLGEWGLNIFNFGDNIRVTQPFFIRVNLLYLYYVLRHGFGENNIVNIKFDSYTKRSPLIIFDANQGSTRKFWAIAQN